MDQSSAQGTAADASGVRNISLKERHRHEREELILRAAEEMLLERGYHDTSLDEIAARVGIAKGTIYLHFASKEDLILALAERGMRTYMRTQDEILAGPGTAREKLRKIIELVYSNLQGRQFGLMTSMMQSPHLMPRMMERRAHFSTLWEEQERRLRALFDAGKASGDFDPDIPSPIMVALFVALLSPHGYRRLVERGGMAPEEVMRSLSAFFFRGIAADATHHASESLAAPQQP